MKKHLFLFATTFNVNATLFQNGFTRNEFGFACSVEHKSLIKYNIKTKMVNQTTFFNQNIQKLYNNFGTNFFIYVAKRLNKFRHIEYSIQSILFHTYDFKLYKYYFKLTQSCNALCQSHGEYEDRRTSRRKFNLEQFIQHIQYFVEHVKEHATESWFLTLYQNTSSEELIDALDKIYKHRIFVPKNITKTISTFVMNLKTIKFIVEDLCLSHDNISFNFSNSRLNLNSECIEYLMQFSCINLMNITLKCESMDDLKFIDKYSLINKINISLDITKFNILEIKFYFELYKIIVPQKFHWRSFATKDFEFFQYTYEHFDKTNLNLNEILDYCNDFNVYWFVKSKLLKH